MLEEQKTTFTSFNHTFQNRNERLLVYGTGINAQAVVENFRGKARICGLLDEAKTGQNFFGLKVVSLEEAVNLNIDSVVIVARNSVIPIIYKRINVWATEHHIFVTNIYGDDLATELAEEQFDNPYFRISRNLLEDQIDNHDVISFDIFDTLITRDVYDPADVFNLLENFVFPDILDFAKNRAESQRELEDRGLHPNIYDIYENLVKRFNIISYSVETLVEEELNMEIKLLFPRFSMLKIFYYAINKGKKVYLLSDMYIPKQKLKIILEKLGIKGYADIWVSCDKKLTKTEGLFEVLRNKEKRSILHIGDNQQGDDYYPRQAGIDTFVIWAPKRMLEESRGKIIANELNAFSNRLTIGSYCSKVFNDPFSLYKTNGKMRISSAEELGYSYIGPFFETFLIWMINNIKDEQATLLFGARDGYLFQKGFHILSKKWNVCKNILDFYIPSSRAALRKIETSNIYKERYILYLRKLGIRDISGKIYFFDFMSKGSCQYYLEKILNTDLCGIYVQKSNTSEIGNNLQFLSYYDDRTAMNSSRNIFALCDFLECIFTDGNPSFKEINEEGEIQFEDEIRTDIQLELVRKIQTGILKYVEENSNFYAKCPSIEPSIGVVDSIMGLMQSRYSISQVANIESIILDDKDKSKNVGKDIFGNL
jgi:FMN phosphatase YigB (HAD superfamily)